MSSSVRSQWIKDHISKEKREESQRPVNKSPFVDSKKSNESSKSLPSNRITMNVTNGSILSRAGSTSVTKATRSIPTSQSNSLNFAALAKEHGYVKARHLVKETSNEMEQKRLKIAEDQRFQSFAVERMRQAIRISATLGEPSGTAKGAIEKILDITHESITLHEKYDEQRQLMRKRKRSNESITDIPNSQSFDRNINRSGPSMNDLNTENAMFRTLLHDDGNMTLAQLGLETLPSQLGLTLFLQTSYLKSINLPRNKLSNVFSSSQLASIHFRYIVQLNLADNRLASLPEDIGNMKSLQELDVSGNLLTVLPRTMMSLKMLRKLNISNNKFTDLDMSLSNLHLTLEHLNISSNQLIKLPNVISKLTNLIYLNISNNILPHLAFIPSVAGPSALWQEIVDSNTGKIVYYNVLIREKYAQADMNKPNVLSLIENDPHIHTFQENTKTSLKQYRRRKLWLSICNIPEWESVIDLRSGWNYYRNNVSGQTQWEIPPDIDLLGDLKNLQVFIANNNIVRVLPPSFVQLSKLKKFSMLNNRLIDLPADIHLMSSLEHIQVNHNELKLLPTSICQLQELTYLAVQSNQLIRLPEKLGSLPKLEHLDASVNKLKQPAFSLGYCDSLKTLMLFENPLVDPPIEELSKGIDQVKWYFRNRHSIVKNNSKPPEMQFRKIGIMNEVNLIQSDYDARIAHLIDLSKSNRGILNLQFMGLTTLPSDIARMTSLKRLLLDYNPSLDLQSIGFVEGEYLRTLKVLSIRSCNIQILPENVGNLRKLQVLHCDVNQLEFIPLSMLKLRSLQTLDLSKNRIYEIPERIDYLYNLKVLNLESNCLESVPEEIGSIPSLVSLNLSRNNIHDIPNKICELSKLKKLNLSDNQLYYLPKEIRHMNLVELRIDHNRIELLVESLFSYELGKSIKYFTCTENNLLDLPNSIYLIDPESTFSADYNPLVSPPSYLLTEGLSTIQKYMKYRQLRTEELEKLLYVNNFIFIRSYSKPYACEVLDDGLGFLTPDDVEEFDFAVNEYLNGEYYNCPSSAEEIVMELVDLRDDRENRLYLTILETFIQILKNLVMNNRKAYPASVLYADTRPWGQNGEECNVYVVSIAALLRDISSNSNPLYKSGRTSIFNLLSKAIPSMPFTFTVDLLKDCLRLYISPYGKIADTETVVFPSCDCFDERRRRPFNHPICEKKAVVIVQTIYSEEEAIFREIEEEEYFTHFEEISTDIKAWLRTKEGKRELEKEVTRRRASAFENLHAREELVVAEENKMKEAQEAVKKWTRIKQSIQAKATYESNDLDDAIRNITMEEERIVRCANRAEALRETVVKLNEDLKKELKDRKIATIEDVYTKYCALHYLETVHVCRKLCAHRKLRRPWDGNEGELYEKWLRSYAFNDASIDKDMSLERALDQATEAHLAKRHTEDGTEYNWDDTDDMTKYDVELYVRYKNSKKK